MLSEVQAFYDTHAFLLQLRNFIKCIKTSNEQTGDLSPALDAAISEYIEEFEKLKGGSPSSLKQQHIKICQIYKPLIVELFTKILFKPITRLMEVIDDMTPEMLEFTMSTALKKRAAKCGYSDHNLLKRKKISGPSSTDVYEKPISEQPPSQDVTLTVGCGKFGPAVLQTLSSIKFQPLSSQVPLKPQDPHHTMVSPQRIVDYGGQYNAVEAMMYDKNYFRPRHCVCLGLPYGPMIRCDNVHCAIKVCHLICVGITDIPGGLWFCPPCVGIRNFIMGQDV